MPYNFISNQLDQLHLQFNYTSEPKSVLSEGTEFWERARPNLSVFSELAQVVVSSTPDRWF